MDVELAALSEITKKLFPETWDVELFRDTAASSPIGSMCFKMTRPFVVDINDRYAVGRVIQNDFRNTPIIKALIEAKAAEIRQLETQVKQLLDYKTHFNIEYHLRHGKPL